MKQIFIDFIGVPGSGKTTIARELLLLLKQGGHTVRTNRSLDPAGVSKNTIGRICAYFFLNFFTIIKICFICLRANVVRHIPTIIELHLTQTLLLKQSSDITIRDQGLINFLLTLYAKGRLSDEQYKRLTHGLLQKEVITSPNFLIYIETPDTVIADRILSREKEHFLKTHSRKSIAEYSRRYIDTIDITRSSLPDHSSMLIIDGTLPIDRNVEYLYQTIIKQS